MGLMEAPSGAKFCYVNQKFWRGNYYDSDAKCKELGFDGLLEARTNKDKDFLMELLICKSSLKYICNYFLYCNFH